MILYFKKKYVIFKSEYVLPVGQFFIQLIQSVSHGTYDEYRRPIHSNKITWVLPVLEACINAVSWYCSSNPSWASLTNKNGRACWMVRIDVWLFCMFIRYYRGRDQKQCKRCWQGWDEVSIVIIWFCIAVCVLENTRKY